MQSEKKTLRKVRTGDVVSDRMDKTVVVQIQRRTPHRLYGKILTISKKYKVHDEKNVAHTGDRVQIEETRPLSRQKRWRLVKIIRKGEVK